jgi:hypothetical protein
MPSLHFNVHFGAISQDRLLQFLCWELELPPSKIHLQERNLEVPYTPRTAEIMFMATKSGGCKISNPRVTGSSYYITFTKRPMPELEFTCDTTGYNMLAKVSGGHPISGEWEAKKKQWNMTAGLGRNEDGIKAPIQLATKFKRLLSII